MSGGALDYVSTKLFEHVSNIRAYGKTHDLPQFRAFADHLDKVAEALHDVEWVMSSDYGLDGADKSIDTVFGDLAREKTLQVLLEDLKATHLKLVKLLGQPS